MSFSQFVAERRDPLWSASIAGAGVVVTDLASRAPVTLGHLPAVVIGLTDSAADGFDAVVSPNDEATLAAMCSSVETHPIAAATLVNLLRGGESRSVADGLVAESMAYGLLQAGPEFTEWRTSHRAKPVVADRHPAVLLDRVDTTLTLTLNRPSRHNAFSAAMRDELFEALSLAVVDLTIERVVLTGNGPSFCSGGDLDEFGSRPDPATAHLVRLTRSPAALMHHLTQRTSARVHGACLGAGIELPAFARRIVAAPDAIFGLPEIRLGLIPGAGGTVSVPRRIGRQRTALLALTGEPIDATTALRWGLIDEISSAATG